MSKRATLYAAVGVLAIVGLLPLAVMCLKSVLVDGRLSFDYYRGLFASGRAWILLANSLRLALWTTAVVTAVGVPLGILFAKTDLPARRTFTALFTVPLLAPPYITAVSWFDLVGASSAWLFGLPGCVLVLSSAFLPITMLLTIALLRTLDPRLEEAARLVSGWGGVLKGITVPLILPGILLASSLVFLLAMGEFGVPMFFRYDVFPVESFTQFSAFLNFGAATASAMPLVFVTLLLLGAEWLLFRSRIQHLRPAAGDASAVQIRLGAGRIPILIAVAVLCAVVVVAPFSGLLIQSADVSAYVQAWQRAGGSLLRSIGYAALGAALLTLLGFLIGYFIHSRALAVWRTVDGFTLMLFAMPGTVIGIGLVALWNHPLTTFVYTTPAIILLGYLAQYLALTSRFTVATLCQIPNSMEEAAQMAGADWWRRILWIVAPLAGRGLLAAWLVAYIFCLRDLSISTMVYPPGHDLFTTRTFTLMANGAPEMIAALCVLLLGATLLPLGALSILFGRGRLPHAVH